MAATAAAGDKVLILASTVSGGTSSVEAQEAAALGYGVDIVDDTTWKTMVTSQFAAYRAIILGDPNASGTAPVAAAESNTGIWGPALTGNVEIVGTDPVGHDAQGGRAVTRRGVQWAASQPGKTGAYITLSEYYSGVAPNTPVKVLDALAPGGFTVRGVGCEDRVHIVAASPALADSTDATLSNWNCSVHSAFDSWPSRFGVLAIDTDAGSNFTGGDGSTGRPYVLVSSGGQNVSATAAMGLENPSTNIKPCQEGDYPINCATGNFWHSFTDAVIPGRGPGIDLNRTYNSALARVDGPFGFGWSSSYSMSLTTDSKGTVRITQENGSQLTFTPDGSGGYRAPAFVLATLNVQGNGDLTLIRRQREHITFAPDGRLASINDLNSNATAVFPLFGNTVVRDGAGRQLTLSFDGRHFTKATDPAGRTVTYSYDGAGNLTDVIDVNGGHSRFTYDANHRLLTMREPKFFGDVTTVPSPVVTNDYDAQDRVVRQSDPIGRVTTFDYTSIPDATKITDPAGNITVQTYAGGVLKSLTKGYGTPQAATSTYRHDTPTLDVTSVTDANNHTTTATYDGAGNRLSLTDALNRRSVFTYDWLNDLTSFTDPKGVKTSLTYDSRGNQLTRSAPLLDAAGATVATQVTRWNYLEDGNTRQGEVTSVVDPNGQRWRFGYDGYGNVASVLDPLGHKTTAAYDTSSRKTSSVSARGFTTTYGYDPDGLLIRVTDPMNHVTRRQYDANRNLGAATDAENRTTTYLYDAADQLTGVRRHDATSLRNEYFPDGRLKRQVDGAGAPTNYGYDSVGRLATATDPAGRTTTYRYDAAGNAVSKQDPGGNCVAVPKVGCTAFGYNVADEMTSITYSDGVTPNVTIGYDANGQRTSMTDGTGTSSWARDSLGRLTASTTGSALAGGAQTVRYGYDLRNAVTSLTYPGGATVNRTYDAAGNLGGVTDWTGSAMSLGYDADDNLSTRGVPGSLNDNFTYDAAGQLSKISVTSPTSSDVSNLAYGRDSLGQVTSSSGSLALPESNTYTYTDLNQLKTENGKSYGYDAADNLTRLANGTNQAFDVANQLCWTAPNGGVGCGSPPRGSTTFGYDTRGNRTRTLHPYATVDTTYDGANRMTATTTRSSEGVVYGVVEGDIPVPADYDGDNRAEIAVFRPSLGTWHVMGADPGAVAWGMAGDIPVPADYDGDGDDDIAVFRPSNGTWYVRDNPAFPVTFGTQSGDVPVPADYDGDGDADVAIFRSGTWFVRGNSAFPVTYGTQSGDKAVPADYDGDGRTDVAIFRSSTGEWYVRANPAFPVTYGTQSGDLPLAKDYDGDGDDDVAIFRRATGQWFVRGNANFPVTYGTSTGDVAVPADYDGDHKTDLGIFRPSNGTWYVRTARVGTTTYQYDGGGMRAAKTTSGVTTRFTWDESGPLPLLLSETTDGAITRYIYDDKGLPLEQVGPDGVRTYMHHDQLGSVRMLTQDGANVKATFTYDAYGTKTASTGTVTTPFGFAGEYTDAETGFVYLRARYYDPSTGQFISRDPIESITQSPYAYVDGNPLNYTDPLGLLTLKGFLKGAALGLGGAALIIGTAGIAAPSLAVLGVGAATLSTGLGAASTVASIGVAAIDCNRRWDLNCFGDIAEAAGGAVTTAFGIPAITQGRTGLRFMSNLLGFLFDAAAFVEVDLCEPTVGQRLSRGERL